MIEDWELTELYRKLQLSFEEGQGSQEEVYQKIKDKFFVDLPNKRDFYLILGTHFRFGTYIIVSVIYPKKADTY